MFAAIVAVVVGATVAVGVVMLAGAEDPRPQVERGVPVHVVLDEPGRFRERSVTVTGEADIVTDRVMTIGHRDLIVVAADSGNQNFDAGGFAGGDVVHATGDLELLDAEQTVSRLPGPSLLPSQFQDFERQPVLIASSVVSR